ncbi:D-sedoheptulose-7-phosphate isomerase [Nitrosopumilus sp.]|uniref:D-sedoheptulose-7-phosphate isomerase n=1 Tax=Nitrosopumilus sp. TaxID=2024843 RepID=UPI003D153416
MNYEKKIEKLFDDSINTISKSKKLKKEISESANIISKCLEKNGKIIAFGNGGSAADSQHFVAEFIGRFQKERKSMPAISFTTDTSIITAIGNDYGFEKIFERQSESLVRKNDVVVAISTSGKSKNVVNGVKIAKRKGAKIICLTGNTSKILSNLSDVEIAIPSKSTPRIQEVHRLILHFICEIVEDNFSKN